LSCFFSKQTAVILQEPGEEVPDYSFEDMPPIFEREVIKQTQPKVERPITTIIEKPEVVDNETPDPEITIITDPVDDNKPVVDVTKFKEEIEEEGINEEDDPTPISMNYVTKIPVFAGCEKFSKKSEKEGRKCFDRKMNKLVNRYFDSDLGKELGLKSGKHKIHTQFVIDKSGNVVDVKIRAPHPSLRKEVNRVVKKIPTFTPGEKNDEKVNVRYTLPITFQVE